MKRVSLISFLIINVIISCTTSKNASSKNASSGVKVSTSFKGENKFKDRPTMEFSPAPQIIEEQNNEQGKPVFKRPLYD